MAQSPNSPRLPGATDRTLILGHTGSGKTVAGLWHLARQPLNRQRWVLVDSKNDEHIAGLEERGLAREIAITARVPRRRGLYIIRPMPHQREELDAFLWNVHAAGSTGLYFDEGYMVEGPALEAILTQGRALGIPVVMLSQRPVWLSRFAISEAQYFHVFALTDQDDWRRVRQFTGLDLSQPIPEYFSRYYDVRRRRAHAFSPVPMDEANYATIEGKLKPGRTLIAI